MTGHDLDVEFPDPDGAPPDDSTPGSSMPEQAVPDAPRPGPPPPVAGPPRAPQPHYATAADDDQDGYSGVIPYRNKPALIGYYCAVFALIPLFPIGLAALAFGVVGLKRVRRDPRVRGTAHAWIGIIVGGGLGILWLLLSLGMVVAVLNK